MSAWKEQTVGWFYERRREQVVDLTRTPHYGGRAEEFAQFEAGDSQQDIQDLELRCGLDDGDFDSAELEDLVDHVNSDDHVDHVDHVDFV